MCETLNCALVDTGCSANVCGANWLKCYMDTIPMNIVVPETQSGKRFTFGDGKTYHSVKQVNIPVHIGGVAGHILTDVVECEIPLLLSKKSLKDANSQLDFVNDTITLYGRKVNLQHTSNGHYCLPLTPKQEAISHKSKANVHLTFTSSTANKDDKHNVALKLHKQFGHPVDSGKLKKLLHEAEIHDDLLEKEIDNVTNNCETCSRYKKARSRPVVCFSFARNFNECLAMDLKFVTIQGKIFIVLHMIDVFTRYSAASIIKSKHKETIVDAVLKHWVALFGTPDTILSDNGGEFNNDLLRDVAELLNTKVLATAAESPWSNGIVERHNAVIGNMILKIIHDTNCSIEHALVWAISAKNALHNNLGFSPNQLVFGRNPNLPTVLSAKPPALRTITTSDLIASHLNALHSARRAFIQSESSSKLKVALQRQTLTATSKHFLIGDQVYYKRNDQKEWKGPGTIIGIDGKQVLVRHGGSLVRVSPCHLQKINDAEIRSNSDHAGSISMDDSDNITIGNDDSIYIPSDSDQPKDVQPGTAPPLNCHQLENSTDSIQPNVLQPTCDQPDYIQPTQSPATDILTQNIADPLTQPSPDISCLKLPHLQQRISFIDPDTKERGDYMVISRAGKATGIHKNWLNVKHLSTGAMKAVDFEKLESWDLLEDEILYNTENTAEVLDAQQQELQKWKEYSVYTEVKDKGQDAITTRWVMTEKNDGNTKQIKARLVARGYEEDSSKIRTDSPTIGKENLRLITTIAANNHWKIHSLDIKAAFLQGYPIDRSVHLLPPTEANTNKLWKLNTSVYGLCDASRAWYLKVSKELLKLGATKCKYDNALFFWRENGKIQGILCCHVDDFFFAGNQLFHKHVIQPIRDTFSLSKENTNTFSYLGIEIKQSEDGITMHQNSYIETLKPMSIQNKSNNRLLSPNEIRDFKALIGQMQWVSKQTRPDMSFATCNLSTHSKKATTTDVRMINKQLRKLKEDANDQMLFIPNIGDISQSSIVVFSDASHANLPDGGSQGGFLILLLGPNGKASPIIWKSHKLKRVVKCH